MFFRTKTINNSSLLQLVASYRNAEGLDAEESFALFLLVAGGLFGALLVGWKIVLGEVGAGQQSVSARSRGFRLRTAKSILETRPIYHRRDQTIRGHVFCSFLALCLKRELELRMAHS